MKKTCRKFNFETIWKMELPRVFLLHSPLNGLYLTSSPYMSSRFTFSPLTASCEIVNCTLIEGFDSTVAPAATATLPYNYTKFLQLSIHKRQSYLPECWATSERQFFPRPKSKSSTCCRKCICPAWSRVCS